MSKKKKWLIIGIIVVCLAALILAVIMYKRKKAEEFEEEHIIYKYTEDVNTIQYVEFDENTGGICMVISGEYMIFNRNIFDGKYIYLEDIDYIQERYGDNEKIVNKADINIYNLETMEFVKTIDLKGILEKYVPERLWLEKCGLVRTEEGDVFFRTSAGKCSGISIAIEKERIYINLVTDEVTVLEIDEVSGNSDGYEKEEENKIESYRTFWNLVKFDEIGIMKRNGLPENIEPYISRGYFYWGIEIPKESMPTGEARLYQKFPGLKDYEMRDDETLCVCLDITKSEVEELIELFLEEGQEISFEGCVLPAESSVDGKEHEINSFEDYYQWKKWDEY